MACLHHVQTDALEGYWGSAKKIHLLEKKRAELYRENAEQHIPTLIAFKAQMEA